MSDAFGEDLERLLLEGANLDADRDGWRRDLQVLVARAKALAAREPGRASGPYAVARLAWLDPDRELVEPRALAYLRQAAAVDPGFLPAVALARHVSDFLGAFAAGGALLDEAVRWAEVLVDRTGGHPGATALLAAQRAFRRTCTGGADCLWRAGVPGREAWKQLETEIRFRVWDGVHVCALPLW
jgi:hypothetical protein